MFENLKISITGIWSHKLRSILTMLGIIIGIAAIIAIVSTIEGTRDQIRNNMIGAGTVDVRLKIGDTDFYQYATDDATREAYGVPVLTEEDRKELEELPHVAEAGLYRERNFEEYDTVKAYYNDASISSLHLVGVDNHYLSIHGYVVAEGRPFSESDFSHYRKVCMINYMTASELFQDVDPVGKTVDIGKEPFTVIGVYTSARESSVVINSPEDYVNYGSAEQKKTEILIPGSCWQMIIGFDDPQNVIIRPDSTENISAVANAASKKLTKGIKPMKTEDVDSEELDFDDSSAKAKYDATEANKSAQEDEQLQQSTQNQLVWIASISLLVGGIGVMNIMLVSVTERTREIGLKKAIGARKKSIMLQFLTEAAVLTSLGGMIGVLAGIATAEVIQKVNNIPISISVPWIIISLGFSTLIGIVFGFLPAVQASNMDPIVALRYE